MGASEPGTDRPPGPRHAGRSGLATARRGGPGPTIPPMPNDPVVDLLEQIWRSTAQACAGLTEPEWEAPTDCPGWTVRDHLSHLIGTELRPARRVLAAAGSDPVPDYVRNPIGQINEAWIEARRRRAGDRSARGVRRGDRPPAGASSGVPARRAVRDVVGWSPSARSPYRDFMQVRAFDSWVHGQDIRWAVDRPGDRDGRGEAISIGSVALGLPFVVGRKVAPPDGTTVVFEIEGPLARTVALEMVAGRAQVRSTARRSSRPRGWRCPRRALRPARVRPGAVPRPGRGRRRARGRRGPRPGRPRRHELHDLSDGDGRRARGGHR